jgi:hypothetical protein
MLVEVYIAIQHFGANGQRRYTVLLGVSWEMFIPTFTQIYQIVLRNFYISIWIRGQTDRNTTQK